MTDVSVKDAGAATLRWGHAALDRVFADLPSFGAAIIVTTDADLFARLSLAMDSGLAAEARRAGLGVVTLAAPELLAAISVGAARAVDLALVRANEGELEAPGMSEALRRWPSALLVLSRASLTPWRGIFDLEIKLDGKNATIDTGDSPARTVACAFAAAGKPGEASGDARATASPIAGRGHAPRLVGLNLPAALDNAVATQARAAGCEWTSQLPSSLASIDVAIVADSWPAGAEHVKTLSARGAQIIAFLPLQDTRAQDRAAIYAAGARAILAPRAEATEVGAFLRANVEAWRTQSDPVSKLDAEFDRLIDLSRRVVVSEQGTLETAMAAYAGVLENRVLRSAMSAVALSAVIITLPENAAKTAGGARFAVGLAIDAGLRRGDLVLHINSHVIVASPGMNTVAGRAIVRRIQSVLDSGVRGLVKATLIEGQVVAEAEAGAEARRLMKALARRVG